MGPVNVVPWLILNWLFLLAGFSSWVSGRPRALVFEAFFKRGVMPDIPQILSIGQI